MKPRLVYSALTRCVMIVTRYRDKGRYIISGGHQYVFDVTEDFKRLRRKPLAKAVAP